MKNRTLLIAGALQRLAGYALTAVGLSSHLSAFPAVVLAGGGALVVEGVLTEREATR